MLTLGERECSIQRRHQKLIEESPSPALDAETREEMEAAAERACHAIGYRNAGTFEFLLGPDGALLLHRAERAAAGRAPGHASSCTGIDIVREQLRIAAGERLARTGRAERRGHAIEVRLNAEDPDARLRARARVASTRFRPPLGPGVRLDTLIEDGATDPAVLRLAARQADRLGRHARRRDRARAARARRARIEACPRRRAASRSTSSAARASRAAATRRASSRTRPPRCPPWPARADGRPPRRAPHGARPPLPVGRDRPGARVALRGRGRRLRARAGRGASSSGTRSSTAGSPRPPTVDGRPARRARAEHPAHRDPGARPRRGAGRGRDRRGGRAREALLVRRRRPARQRHPRAHRDGRRTA